MIKEWKNECRRGEVKGTEEGGNDGKMREGKEMVGEEGKGKGEGRKEGRGKGKRKRGREGNG